jgi:hypothetical protein
MRTDQTAGTPIFFGGINVFLEQQSALFRKSPGWLHRLLASPSLLKLAAGAAGKTRAEDLGELTISMLRGEEGHQARELDDLIRWLRLEKPDVVCLSNSLLAGMARRIRAEVRAPVICSLQGEDFFLDGLPSRTAPPPGRWPPNGPPTWTCLSRPAAILPVHGRPAENPAGTDEGRSQRHQP